MKRSYEFSKFMSKFTSEALVGLLTGHCKLDAEVCRSLLQAIKKDLKCLFRNWSKSFTMG